MPGGLRAQEPMDTRCVRQAINAQSNRFFVHNSWALWAFLCIIVQAQGVQKVGSQTGLRLPRKQSALDCALHFGTIVGGMEADFHTGNGEISIVMRTARGGGSGIVAGRHT